MRQSSLLRLYPERAAGLGCAESGAFTHRNNDTYPPGRGLPGVANIGSSHSEVDRVHWRLVRSYSALNSQPSSAMAAIRYIQTSKAMPAPMEPYITL